MKTKILCLILLITTLSCCSELKNPSRNQPIKRIELDIYNSNWFTKTDKLTHAIVGHVQLAINGRTNAERLTIRGYGDGLYTDHDIKIGTNGLFNDTIEISFTYISPIPDKPIFKDSKTLIKAYLGSKIIDSTIYSGPLQYEF